MRGGGELEGEKKRESQEEVQKGEETNKNTFFLRPSLFSCSNPVSTMAAVDVAFKATCATLFAAALASGAWLTASMVKGYNDAQEYQV